MFVCHDCGLKVELSASVKEGAPASVVCKCGHPLARDFGAEIRSSFIGIPSYMSARTNVDRNDVLPTAKDFEAPGDSDGSRGYKEWNDKHAPVNRKAWV